MRTPSARGGRRRPGPIALNLVVVDGSSAAGGIENADPALRTRFLGATMEESFARMGDRLSSGGVQAVADRQVLDAAHER